MKAIKNKEKFIDEVTPDFTLDLTQPAVKKAAVKAVATTAGRDYGQTKIERLRDGRIGPQNGQGRIRIEFAEAVTAVGLDVQAQHESRVSFWRSGRKAYEPFFGKLARGGEFVGFVLPDPIDAIEVTSATESRWSMDPRIVGRKAGEIGD